MAVDQATTHPDFFKYLLSINNNNGVLNPYGNGNGIGVVMPAAAAANEAYVLPYYGINDVVFNSGVGKFAPAVKDDSGVTFNNSFVAVTAPATPTRKRQRETAVLPAVTISGGGNIPSTNCGSMVINKQEESNGFSFLGEDISFQIMQQQIEIDRLISQHIEKMKMEVEERKKHQLRRIMAAIEASMSKTIRQKDEQISKIAKINFELEERVKTLYLENQLWRDLAQSNEATANALRSNLEQCLHQMRDNAERSSAAEDAVSCCGSSGGEEREREREREIDGVEQRIEEDGKKWVYRGEKNKRLCRKCREGESSVLLLPCRHLCLCTSCGPVVNTCPICNAVKNASVHVNLS